MAPIGIIKIAPIPDRVLSRVLPTNDIAINSAQNSLAWLNDLAAILPQKYEWKFKTVEGLKKEISSDRITDSVNSRYWQDQLRVCEAYSVMASFRILDLARGYVQSLEIENYLGAAIAARSAFEGTVQYLDPHS